MSFSTLSLPSFYDENCAAGSAGEARTQKTAVLKKITIKQTLDLISTSAELGVIPLASKRTSLAER